MGVMTHATDPTGNRHDTLAAVTGKSGRGTARQTIRVDEDLWARFGAACDAADTDRSVVLRAYIARYIRMHPIADEPAAPESD